eukprot:SAG11_NODE_83_length_17378_cov_5.388622_9_plen_217_part_00
MPAPLRSIQSIPRTIKLDPFNNTRLIFEPIEEVATLRQGAPVVLAQQEVKAGKAVPMSAKAAGNQLDVVANFSGDFTKPGITVGVCVLADGSMAAPEPAEADAGAAPSLCNGFAVSVSSSGSDPTLGEVAIGGGGGSGPFLLGPSTQRVSLRILVDRSVVEAFAQGGRGVVTHRVYPTKTATGVSVVNLGTVSVQAAVSVHQMATAEPPTTLLLQH